MPNRKKIGSVGSYILLILLSGMAFAVDANVAGTWTVVAKNGRRSVTQTIVFQQEGGQTDGDLQGAAAIRHN